MPRGYTPLPNRADILGFFRMKLITVHGPLESCKGENLNTV